MDCRHCVLSHWRLLHVSNHGLEYFEVMSYARGRSVVVSRHHEIMKCCIGVYEYDALDRWIIMRSGFVRRQVEHLVTIFPHQKMSVNCRQTGIVQGCDCAEKSALSAGICITSGGA